MFSQVSVCSRGLSGARSLPGMGMSGGISKEVCPGGRVSMFRGWVCPRVGTNPPPPDMEPQGVCTKTTFSKWDTTRCDWLAAVRIYAIERRL